MEITQYDVVIVNLDPAKGSEVRKVRPCVIVSPDEMNRNLNTAVVIPLTSSLKTYPTRVPVYHNDKKGMAAVDQIRTIDKSRIISVKDKLNNEEISNLKRIIEVTYVL